MRSRLAPLIKLLYRPAEAMTELAVAAPYWFGAALSLITTFIYYDVLSGQFAAFIASLFSAPGPGLATPGLVMFSRLISRLMATASPVIFLAIIFIPACVLAASLIERRASFTVLLRQEYAAIATCGLYGWAAAHLVMLIPALILYNPSAEPSNLLVVAALKLVPMPYFLFLLTLGVRAALRTTSYGRAAAAVAAASCSLLLLPLLPNVFFLLTSPFWLIILFIILRNVFGGALSAQRNKEAFRQNLEASTLNPADASAHYNLGLIYQQRHQYDEAKSRFERAIEIDPDEIDAHYQLGRIAREEGRYADAISHFDAVVQRHTDHSQSEVWREIGRAYFDAGQYLDAAAAFERFLEKRPSDAEGLYRFGLVLRELGRNEQAAAQMQACIEAVRTSPSYKYKTDRRWMNEAESFLRTSAASRQ
jgi:tetratricopeptide (TPR) repeat protein